MSDFKLTTKQIMNGARGYFKSNPKDPVTAKNKDLLIRRKMKLNETVLQQFADMHNRGLIHIDSRRKCLEIVNLCSTTEVNKDE